MSTNIKNVLLDHCVYHNTNQSVEEDSANVFKTSCVPHLLAVGELLDRCCIVVHGNEDGSKWLGRLQNNSCPISTHYEK